MIGTGADGFRNGETKGARGLEVDDQLEFCRRLYRVVGWFDAIENLMNVGGCGPAIVQLARPVGDEAPGFYRLPKCVDRWQPVLRGKLNEPFMLTLQHGVRKEHHCPRTRPSDTSERTLELRGATHLQ